MDAVLGVSLLQNVELDVSDMGEPKAPAVGHSCVLYSVSLLLLIFKNERKKKKILDKFQEFIKD